MNENVVSGRDRASLPFALLSGGDAAADSFLYLSIADLTGCDRLTELGPDRIATLFAEALERAGATIVNRLSHLFPGDGITCVLVLAESHAVLHTWPESGTVNIDIFSCSNRLNGPEAIEDLGRSLGARHVSVQEIPRADGHLRTPEPGA